MIVLVKIGDIMQEKLYSDVLKKAYKSAFYILKDDYEAEEIAQQCAIKYFTRDKEILSPLAWVSVVAKNAAIKKAQSIKFISLDTHRLPDLSNDLPQQCLDKYLDDDFEEPENLDVIPEEAKELLNMDDLKVYKLILKYGKDINQIAGKLKLSYNSTASRVYRAKRNLKAAKLLKEGYVGTKNIINYQLNKNIIKFINILKKKLNNNDLTSLSKYFADYNSEMIEKVLIKKTYDYEIIKVDCHKYSLCIPYKDFLDKMQFIQVYIAIDKFNHIRITKFYTVSSTVFKIQDDKDKIINKLPKSKKGIIPNKYEETVKILE